MKHDVELSWLDSIFETSNSSRLPDGTNETGARPPRGQTPRAWPLGVNVRRRAVIPCRCARVPGAAPHCCVAADEPRIRLTRSRAAAAAAAMIAPRRDCAARKRVLPEASSPAII
ncbi:hypothetical protein X946_5044 [Burkholderia sp. ABCPW 111]|nr:hypothetical protein X946_5044 [Burkholderia sp. ABCPW 111]